MGLLAIERKLDLDEKKPIEGAGRRGRPDNNGLINSNSNTSKNRTPVQQTGNTVAKMIASKWPTWRNNIGFPPLEQQSEPFGSGFVVI